MGTPIFLFDNRFNDGAITTTDMAAYGQFGYGAYPWGGRDLSPCLTDCTTYNFWQALDTGVQYLKVRCLGARAANCLAIGGHNLKTAGVQVSVEASSDDFATVTEVLAPFVPPSDKPFLRPFTLTHKADWRLKLSAGQAPARIAIPMIGLSLQFPYPVDAPYIPAGRGLSVTASRSRKGHPLSAIINYETIEMAFRVSNLDRAWALQGFGAFTWGGLTWGQNGNLTALWNYISRLKPLFYAWDYAACPNEAYLVWMKPNQRFETPLSLLALIDSYGVEFETIEGL